jgi:hypothetical protein
MSRTVYIINNTNGVTEIITDAYNNKVGILPGINAVVLDEAGYANAVAIFSANDVTNEAGNNLNATYAYTPIMSASQHNLAIDMVTKLSPPLGTTYAIVQVAAALAKYTIDGTVPVQTPTAIGMTLNEGASLPLNGYNTILNFQVVGAGATLDVEYYK